MIIKFPNLQINKLLSLANLSCIESVDSLKLAQSLDSKCAKLGRKIDVLVQVKPEATFDSNDINILLRHAQISKIKDHENGNSNNIEPQVAKLKFNKEREALEYSFAKTGLGIRDLKPVLDFVCNDSKALVFKGLMTIGEPDDCRVFRVMENLRKSVEGLYGLENLGKCSIHFSTALSLEVILFIISQIKY